MADDSLLTLKQLANELGLPESTVRYYRDQYIDQIPSVGSGRRRRYPPEAVAILRSIAESYAAGGNRADIANGATRAAAVPVVGAAEPAQHTMDHVTNLDLLAAILDGEREQRDALWQMAKEIVRLTEVLQDQDQVLMQIADKAGVEVKGHIAAPRSQPALGAGAGDQGRTAATPVHAPPPPPTSAPVAKASAEPLATQASSALRPQAPDSSIEKLKRELEEERQLVERLREAKLQLERRTADAEAALEDRGANPLRKSGSVLRRLLGGHEE